MSGLLLSLLLLLVGVTLLTLGADRLVAGSSAIALRTGISPLLIGLTVVAIATSSPELMVSLLAALQDRSAIAVGNVVGSNIANIALVLGVAAVLCPVPGSRAVTHREMPVMLGVSILLLVLVFNGFISRLEGVLLLGLLLCFIAFQIVLARRQMTEFSDSEEVLAHQGIGIRRAIVYILIGVVGLYLGSEAFIRGAVDLGMRIGISEAVIGLTVVSVGTSLPELAATVAAAWKRQTDLVLGNIIGSNIFNVLCVLGLTATIVPLHAGGVGLVDLGVMLAFALLVWLLFLYRGRAGRAMGLALLLSYAGYVYYLFA